MFKKKCAHLGKAIKAHISENIHVYNKGEIKHWTKESVEK